MKGLGEPPEGVLTVDREIDVVSLELESAPERIADGGLVVDDENLHVAIVRDLPLAERES